MSCSRGSLCRTRPQKHQNKTVFKNNLHDTSKKTKILNSLEVSGVCNRCKEIIEWKIKYKKYKPLAAPRKCVGCDQKAIKFAYHVLCTKCASEKKVCSKCHKPLDANDNTICKENTNTNEISTLLKTLPERKRRTILRYLKKQDGLQSPPNLETLLTEMDKINLDAENWSSEDFDDSDLES